MTKQERRTYIRQLLDEMTREDAERLRKRVRLGSELWDLEHGAPVTETDGDGDKTSKEGER